MAEHQIGHRERLRERFEKGGFTGFHDYEVLELLLTFIFRQGDVKPLSKELITFGSFSKVLDASVAELENVKGMGKASALNLHAFRETMAYYFQNHVTVDKEQITKISALIEMLRAIIGHMRWPSFSGHGILLN
jgi:DNA repair protein RadC